MSAAQERVKAAIIKLEVARAALDEACSELSTVIGAAPSYNEIRKLSRRILDERRQLDAESHMAEMSPTPWRVEGQRG